LPPRSTYEQNRSCTRMSPFSLIPSRVSGRPRRPTAGDHSRPSGNHGTAALVEELLGGLDERSTLNPRRKPPQIGTPHDPRLHLRGDRNPPRPKNQEKRTRLPLRLSSRLSRREVLTSKIALVLVCPRSH